MGGPWEDYAPKAMSGPWEDYAPQRAEFSHNETAAEGDPFVVSPAAGARAASETQGMPGARLENDGSGGTWMSPQDYANTGKGSTVDFAEKMGNSLMLNYGDEFAAAAGSLPNLLSHGALGKSRQEILDEIRARQKKFELEDPNAANVADIAGKGIGTMLPLGVARYISGAAPGLLRAMTAGALPAATTAAIDATGQIEGPASLGEYGEKAKDAATTAGGIGAAVGGLGNIGARVIGPWATEAAQRLSGRGVHLTPGELAGGGVKRVEDIATSLPGVGSMVRNRQREGIESVNRAAWDEALEPIRTQGVGARLPANTEMGHDAQQVAQQIFNRRYGAVVPRMRAEFDVPLENEIRTISGAIPQTIRPQYADAIRRHIRENVDLTTPNGNMTGRALQDSLQGLRDEAMNLRRNPGHAYDIDLAQALDDTRDALEASAGRYTATRTMNMFRNINQAYQRFATLRRAGSGVGTVDSVFTPAQLKNAVIASDRSVGKGNSARGTMPLQALAEDAKNTMARQVADSGTPERSALMTLMAGGVGGHLLGIPPGVLGAGAGLAALYSQTGNRAFQRLATFSPQTRMAIRRAIEQATGHAAPVAATFGTGDE